jgi:hypothetical protein
MQEESKGSVKLSDQRSELPKSFKKYLLPLVADSELVAGRGRIKVGVNPHYLPPSP